MALDPSIILGVRPAQFQLADPLESASKSLSLQALMGQRDMQGMQMRQAQQAEADDLATREAFRAGGDQKTIIDRLMGAGQYKPAQALQKTMLETREKEGTINKTRAETMGKLLGFQKESAGALMANPTPENAFAAVNQFERMASSFGMPELGQQAAQQRAAIQAAGNNPEALKRLAAGWALTADKFLPQIEMVNDGKTTRAVDKNFLSNPNAGSQTITMLTTPGQDQADLRARTEGAANRGVQIRGQNMTDARSRETLAAGRWTNDLANGVQVNMATGETRPITVNGQPIQKDPKLTEDQGKATGWLVQADNAFKNMMSAVKATGGEAAKTGLPDVVAGISGPFGVGEGAAKGAANLLRGAERQKFVQAAESLSESLLRAATGAGVNKDEAAQKIKEITPQFGDSDEVIKQKTDAIPLYIESLKVRAGPGAAKLPTIIQNAAPATPASPQQSGGKIRMPGKNITVDF